MKLKKIAQMIALIGVASPVLAQDTAPAKPLQRVEITGSSIKRVAKEGALPIQVITADEIGKAGITSTDDLIRMLSANGTGADNMTSGNNVFGADADRVSGGASYASLRGLGPSATLVLLNGRRIATYGASGKAVDLSSIPLGAISRVEILKDGASAIYGTDAVGGVVNFILRSNYSGLEASGSTNVTQQGGGQTRRVYVLGGVGNYDTDGYNVMASVTFDKNDILRSSDRSFANGFQPLRGLSPDTTGTPFANQLTGAGTALGTNFKVPGDTNLYLQANPLSFQGKCDSIKGMQQYNTALWKDITSPLRTTYSCSYDYGADYVMAPPVERTNLVSRSSIRLAPEHKLILEVLGSHVVATSELTPLQISTSIANKNAYPVGGAYYQDLSSFISTFDKTKPIIYKWRASSLGNRTQSNVTDNTRVMAALEGTIWGWDYKTGISTADSRTQTSLTDGYAYTALLYPALGTGIINPWLNPGQTQTDAAKALLESTKYRGKLQHGKTTLTQFDGSISGEIMKLPAGPLAMAAGFDVRREGYGFGQDVDATLILLAPGNAALPEAKRSIKAVYAELLVPVVKDLEMQLALRRDDYDLVGATTNPKVAIRYQPANYVLFRASASKGFLAPSFVQLYSGSLDQELPNGITDPYGCPLHPADPAYCAIPRLAYKSGGNKNLRPETSKQGSIGMVIEPVTGFSAAIDWWSINSKDRILNRTPQIVLANFAALSGNIIRNADGTIKYVQAGWINAAGSKTRGVDLGLRATSKLADGYKWSASLDGTYTDSFQFAEIAGQPYKEYVGKYFSRDLFLRWKHAASVNLSRGDWSGTMTQSYKSGYKDQVPDGGIATPPAGFNPDVKSYTSYNLTVTYTGVKNMTLMAGISNLLNTDPPFTAHNVDEVVGAGWDPRVADGRGRSFSLQAKYKFR